MSYFTIDGSLGLGFPLMLKSQSVKLYNKRIFKACEKRETAAYSEYVRTPRVSVTQKLPC